MTSALINQRKRPRSDRGPLIAGVCAAIAWAFVVAAPLVHACPICSGNLPTLTLLQHLINSDRAVIARSLGGRDFEVIEPIKPLPALPVVGARVAAADKPGSKLRDLRYIPGEDIPRASGGSYLLLRQALGGGWMNAGPVPAGAANDLRRLVGAKRSSDMTLADWRSRVVMLAPMLEHPVPVLATTAYAEIARAPYDAMRSTRGHVRPSDLRVWLADPGRATRRPLYWLLYGINAGPGEAREIAGRVDRLAAKGGLEDLASLLAADLEAGGAARRAVLRRIYLEQSTRSIPELQEAILAFTVHADAGDAALRRETAETFGRLVRKHRALGGLVAADLARWQYWDAVPDYIVLLRSRVLNPALRQPVLDYLTASGRPEALAAVAEIESNKNRPMVANPVAESPASVNLSGRRS
jgi:hypothetical protein